MFPFVRLAKELFIHRNSPELPVLGTHVSYHRCWPQDIDIFIEMNNGRILTVLDLGRTVLARRVGLLRALKEKRWGLTMAGVSVRYRKRIRVFDKIDMRSRALCADARFMYVEQSMWVRGTCTGHALYRTAVTDANGIVPISKLRVELNPDTPLPPIPEWVAAWITAEDLRPWPPMQDKP